MTPASRHAVRAPASVGIGVMFSVACATAGSGGALEPRYVAVHNALAAMGLAQIGPIHEGSLLHGHEARLSLDLPAGCTTVVSIGGDGVGDIDAKLLDPAGRPIAHDTTTEPQAVLRACIDAPDTYTLVVSAAAGSGTWVAATWAGGIGATPATTALTPVASLAPLGNCASPFPLSAGTFSGTTARGDSTTTGSCANSKADAPELVYELDVTQRERVTIDLQARFDAVLFIRKGECADENAEVDCNDDVPGEQNHSRVEDILEPGKYFVFVDSYKESGGFKLTVTVTETVALSDGCRRALPLTSGAVVASSNTTSGDTTGASCGGGALGRDTPWRMELTEPARVRLVESSNQFAPVVHVRRACAYEESEVACASGPSSGTGEAVVTGVYSPGSYTVFADGRNPDAKGDYTLALDTGAVGGDGTAGDSCAEALPIVARPPGGSGAVAVDVEGDTFPARDDTAGTCGGKGAADVFYRLDVDRRSRLSAQISSEDAPHILTLWRGCGGGAAEVGCGRALDAVVEPGAYFLAVDGLRPDTFGRFAMRVVSEDVSGQASACASAAPLVLGRNAGTLAGASSSFSTSCLSDASGGPDKVYKLVLPSPATVEITPGPGFDGAIALRKTCPDGLGGSPASEIDCESEGRPIGQTLEAGTYWLVVNGATSGHGGAFTLRYAKIGANESDGEDDFAMRRGRVPFRMPVP